MHNNHEKLKHKHQQEISVFDLTLVCFDGKSNLQKVIFKMEINDYAIFGT